MGLGADKLNHDWGDELAQQLRVLVKAGQVLFGH